MIVPLSHELAETARWLAARGLAWGSSGNLSSRNRDDGFLLSASGTWFERIAPDDFVRCELSGRSWVGPRPPSKEIAMHAALYAARPEVRWVLHCTPPAATVLAVQRRAPQAGCFVEDMAYLGEPACVPYRHPGTPELAAAVATAAARSAVLLLEHHGVLVGGTTRDDACMRLLTLEFASALRLRAEGSGIAPAPLPPAIVAEFRERRIYHSLPPPVR